MRRSAFFTLIMSAWVLTHCQHTQDKPRSQATFQDIVKKVYSQASDFENFTRSGPVPYETRKNRLAKLPSGETITFDYLRAHVKGPRPLVIVSHGNHSWKESHRYQGERLASFGMDAMMLQLPNRKKWLSNGQRIAGFIDQLPSHQYSKILLVGHSFGGSAIALAARDLPNISGLIYLDPALVHDKVIDALQEIDKPQLILSADPKVFQSRRQATFLKKSSYRPKRYIIINSTHDDAQYPSMFAVGGMGFDPFTSHEKQNTFTALLTASALSLAAEDNFRYADLIMQNAYDLGLIR